MTESHPEAREPRPTTAPGAAPATSKVSRPGAGRGNRSKTGQTVAKTPDNVPNWHKKAREVLARDFKMGRFRNWGGDAAARNLAGMTVTAPDPRKSRIPNPSRPYLASYGGKQTWHASPASARAEIEAEFVRQENAKREARLAANPFDDPHRRAALYRAVQALRGV